MVEIEHSRGSSANPYQRGCSACSYAAYHGMARFPDKRFSLTKLGKNQPIYGVKLPYLKAKNK